MKPITKEGYDRILEKVKEMKKEFDSLPAIIAEAREKGDLKENAEYHAARERQGMLKAQIGKIEGELAEAQILDPAALNADLVTFGKRVSVKNLDDGSTMEYRIVGEIEADIDKGEIAINTPVAKGLLGKQVGDVATVIAPAGEKRFEITHITV